MFRFGDDVQARREPEEAAQQARRPGKPIEGARLLLQLLRRRWWIIGAAVLGCVAGVATAKTIALQVFESRSAIVWEPREVADVRDLRTRIDSVTLPTSLEEVRNRLGLDARVDDLAERVEVLWDGSSNLVTVKASAAEAEQATRLADTVVHVFLEHQRDLERTRREEEVQVLREDLERAQTSLDEAQSEYDAFRSEHGITDLPVQRQQAIEQAASLRMQADMAEAQIGPGGGSAKSGTVASSGSPRLREARRELARERARFSDQHPKIQALEAEVQVLEKSAQAGGERALEARRRAVEERKERFERVSDQARARLQELSEVEGGASQLLASVRVAESHLADVQAELTQARDAAKNPKSGFRVVAPALVPDEPVSSWRKPAAIAIPTAAVLLVVLLILVNEVRGLRVHTASEVAYWGRAAVVGSSNWPNDPTALNPFIDELGDDAVRASGRTLVLASTDDETDAAQELASRLELVAALRDSGPWPSEDDGPWSFDDV